ncbi:hypothetical protein P3102_07040 [Amycolatopsis sp. QT-25]|uniref:hypothetical protein n=1 Tax=Amycolatopsis sp. QT-25 TaxID=3034022 RepID=UPI0023EB8D62|nr:hypothetical protein [Amycolatopsis sp. QT-25]WET80983.1 hypothetical protein P3102_07040 [Amycolatopsis sp. QT-25]
MAPGGDAFRPEWLAPALLHSRVEVRASATVGLEIGGSMPSPSATRAGSGWVEIDGDESVVRTVFAA